MLVAAISDTHDDLPKTRAAVKLAIKAGAVAIFHCGDLTQPPIVTACCELPFYFVFGNHDADAAADLLSAAQELGATCLNWGGEVQLAGKRIAVVHGHLSSDLRPLLDAQPDYLFTGHFHESSDRHIGKTRRVCSGALYRANPLTFALIDLHRDLVEFVLVS